MIIAFWCTIYLYRLSFFLSFSPLLLLVVILLLLSLPYSLSLVCLNLHPPDILISLTRPNLTNLSTWWKGRKKKSVWSRFLSPLMHLAISFGAVSCLGLSGHAAVSLKCSRTQCSWYPFPEHLQTIWSSWSPCCISIYIICKTMWRGLWQENEAFISTLTFCIVLCFISPEQLEEA